MDDLLTVTDDDLLCAWSAIRQPSWPDTLAETLQEEVRAHLVHTYARQIARSRTRVCKAPTPPTVRLPSPRRPALSPLPAGFVDNKRAAAGDRDDD